MVTTQRRVRSDPGKSDDRGTETGIKVTCDFCHNDVTNTVRFKCAHPDCKDVDICPACFCEGREGQRHRAWHDYMVEESLSTPIFSPEWGADEEMLLISGLITFGLGNWLEVAGHVGTRTKEECERHYCEVYLGVEPDGSPLPLKDNRAEEDRFGKRGREFMPPMERAFDVDPDDFQRRKKARIEEMRKPQALPATATGPMVSAPTNHEIGGYMPGRLEFEHELENEAEMAVKDMEFGLVWRFGGDEQPAAKVTRPTGDDDGDDEEGEDRDSEEAKGQPNGDDVKPEEVVVKAEPNDEPPDPAVEDGEEGGAKQKKGKEKKKQEDADGEAITDVEDPDELEIKLALLDIYFSKLDRREEAKEIIFDRGLTEHKKIQANDRRRPKEERELIQRYKVFAKLQTAQDFEVLIEGLLYEHHLRRRIAELQEYRRNGITTGAEADAYDNAKASRAGYRIAPNRIDRPAEVLTGGRVNAGQHRFLHGAMATPPPDKMSRELTPRMSGHGARRPPTPLNLANAASLDLLSSDEQHLCSALRVLPKPYLTIKEMYIRENERRKGLLKRRDARKMLKIDVNKSGRIFDFLVSSGMLLLSYDPSAKPVMLPLRESAAGGPRQVVEIHPESWMNGMKGGGGGDGAGGFMNGDGYG